MASAVSSSLAPARCSGLAGSAQRSAPVTAQLLQQQARAVAAAFRRRAGGVARQRSQVVARAVPTSLPPGTVLPLNLELPTADFQEGVQLTPLRRQRGGTAIIVQQVAPGSACAAAGVRPGQQLLAISDPIRQSEVWELNGLASIKYVRQAISGRSLETLNVRLSPKPVPEWGQAVEAARAAGGGEGYGAELTAGELAAVQAQLERMQEEAEERKKAVRMGKVERRQGYEKELLEDKRSNTPLFAAAVVLFLGLPMATVLIALSSGYLDTLSPR